MHRLQRANVLDRLKKKGINEKTKNLDTECFEDNIRHIDMVLTYETKESDEMKEFQRMNFLMNLNKMGLEWELHQSLVENTKRWYVLIHAPMETLRYLAAAYQLIFSATKFYGFESVFSMVDNFRLTMDDHEKFKEHTKSAVINQGGSLTFTTCERSYLVYIVLLRLNYGPTSSDSGIQACLKAKIFSDCFPLHDIVQDTTREYLLNEWALVTKIFKPQPIDKIEQYFGEEFGIYFVWVSFYNQMLVYVAFIGIFVFFYGFFNFDKRSEHTSEEVCKSNITLCPYCHHRKICSFTELNKFCQYALYTHWFDNTATVYYALIIVIWAQFLMVFWQRKVAVLKYCWGLKESNTHNLIRPEFEKVTQDSIRICKLTGEPVHFMPFHKVMFRRVFAFVSVMFLVCLVLFSLILTIFVKKYISTRLNLAVKKEHQNRAQFVADTIGGVVTCVLIKCTQKLHDKVSMGLTVFECPKTRGEFDLQYITKRFVFSFVIVFTPLFYIAFFKGRFIKHPGMYINVFTMDRCSPAGCLNELSIQIAVMLVYNQISDTIKKYIFPLGKKFYREYGVNPKYLPRWEQDHRLLVTNEYQIASELEEVALQYGCIVMFIATFSLGPLCALINNLIEERLDARKFLVTFRRPVCRKVADLEAYERIFKVISLVAVCTNALLIAITSDYVARYVFQVRNNASMSGFVMYSLSEFDVNDWENEEFKYEGVHICHYFGHNLPSTHPHKYHYDEEHFIVNFARYAFIFAFEHICLVICYIIFKFIPPEPQILLDYYEVEQKRAREAMDKKWEDKRHKIAINESHESTEI